MTSTLIAPLVGAWILEINQPEESPPSWAVSDPFPDGQYLVQHNFPGSEVYNRRPLIQFNTLIGHTAIVDRVRLTRHRIHNSYSMPFYYYGGTWAATPPAADITTYEGGLYIGEEPENLNADATIELLPSFINVSGITSLKIRTSEEGFGYKNEMLSNLELRIDYHGRKRRWFQMHAQ